MKKIGFIGAFDKTNLIMCLAKILAMKNKKVLIIDTTVEQKCRYIVPKIHPIETYITTWEEIDVAVGFEKLEQIYEYIQNSQTNMEYDVMLINIDRPQIMQDMKTYENDINCFVTGMDLYSIRKGIEIFKDMEQPMKLVKIIFSKGMTKSESEYIDYLTSKSKMEWDEKQIIFPLILDDKYVEIDNQLIYRIGLKKMSSVYKEGLATLTQMLFGDEIRQQDAKKIIKALERKGI